MARSRGETKIVFPLEEQRKPLGLSSPANIAVVFLISRLKKENRLGLGPAGHLGCSQAWSWPGQISSQLLLASPSPAPGGTGFAGMSWRGVTTSTSSQGQGKVVPAACGGDLRMLFVDTGETRW